MEDETRQHQIKLVACTQGLTKFYNGKNEFRLPDDNFPITTYAFMGFLIAEEFDEYDCETRKIIFAVIEEGMTGDYELSTAVAIGLLDGLWSRAEPMGNWDRIKECLGLKSRKYIDLASQPSVKTELTKQELGVSDEALKHIKQFFAISPAFRDIVQRHLTSHDPGALPYAVIFKELGSQIADDFYSIGDAQKIAIFSSIEAAMLGEPYLYHDVWNDLIVALGSRAKHNGNWDKIRSYFDPESRDFANLVWSLS